MIVVFSVQGLLAQRSMWLKTPICVFEIECFQGCMLSLCQAQLFFHYVVAHAEERVKIVSFLSLSPSSSQLIIVFASDSNKEGQ